ncbi:response regulator [Pseudoxanthomonas sp. LH2527]|uniref:response regulator n=1 Tax=Pseudoxanthomonas sp. LH2527 TaxID=2923249 RepID=UPI001F135EC1|nr:response regulator [Pseudoxanthomonas sp. LH2527]MCH6485384.1 response regulator [Pseudoxanthomonas sp. LH2527]
MTTDATPTRVFIIEDEFMLVMLLEELLPTLGYEVAGTAASLDQALGQLPALDTDMAVVDVNLAGTESFPVADALRERGIPFLFTTGYGQHGLPERFADTPVLAKPFRRHDIEAALARLHASR